MTFLLGLLKVLLWDVGQDEPNERAFSNQERSR
jgi:hypothetical protein